MERVITYVDGFNLYFGLKSRNYQRFFWLNIQKLAANLLKKEQSLVFTKYFTARVSDPHDKQKRQETYIEALETLKDFKIYYGKYQHNKQICRKCGFISYVPNEKMTDVNIATEMMTDAFQDSFDAALLISADSDLKGPISSIRKLYPQKKIIIAFPPDRSSFELMNIATAYFSIGRAKIAASVFPPEIKKTDGYILKCPETWK